jgi:hypothetical protein
MMADEIWKDMPGTEYSVSNEGRVASRKKGGWRVMRANPNTHGYLQVGLYDGGGRRQHATVHTLVAEAFLGPRPTPEHQVNHRDGIKTNNRVDNLEWCTPSENQHHRYDVLRDVGPRGERQGHVKVTEAEVREIRRRCAAGELQRVVAADYGIKQATVSLIAKRINWFWLD